jgi:recombination protein RecA
MAKKAAKADGDMIDNLKIDSKLISTLEKTYGDISRSGRDVRDATKGRHIIPISPAHDMALGGGIPEGSWVLISGDEKVGKSSSCLSLIKNAQKPEHGARHTIYLDTEGRVKSMLLDGIIGLDLDMITIISSDDPPLPAEEFLRIAESYMKDNENLIVVIDSISSLIPARDLAEDMSGERRPGLPKLLSNFTKRLSGIVPRKNHIVMMVTHFISNLGAVGNAPKYVADGGTKIRYQADTMLEVSYTQGWEDSDKNQLGQIIHWKIGCSAAGGKPRTQYTSYLRYGHGIDCEFEIVAEAVNLSIVEKSGSWLSYGEVKFQGMAKFADALRADPLLKTEIETKIKELLC